MILATKSKAPLKIQLQTRQHVAARSFITTKGGKWSEVDRPGRSKHTLSRVLAGRARFGREFLVAYYGNERGGRSLDSPLGTVTTRERFAVVVDGRMRMLSVDEYRIAMGFPNGYALPACRKTAIHLLGNAVPPPMVTDVLNWLKTVA